MRGKMVADRERRLEEARKAQKEREAADAARLLASQWVRDNERAVVEESLAVHHQETLQRQLQAPAIGK